MKFNRFLIICFILLLNIATVVAVDADDAVMAVDDGSYVQAVNHDDILETADENAHSAQEDIDIETSSSDAEVLADSDDGTFTSLQKMIDDAEEGSVISLDKDYAYDEGFSVRGIKIDKDLTINGNGHTIDGLSKSRIFLLKMGLITNNKITLNNIKFINGNSDLYGGAIFNYANLTINNCEFSSNNAKIAGGAISSVGHLDCINSKFTKNIADDGGAVFCLSPKLHLDLVNLFNDTTQEGNISYLFNFPSYLSLSLLNDTISSCVFNPQHSLQTKQVKKEEQYLETRIYT